MIAENFNSWQAHILGLQNLIRMRGGVGLYEPVRDAILECDTIGCLVFGTSPYLLGHVDLDDIECDELALANLPYEFVNVDFCLRQTVVAMQALCESMNQIIAGRGSENHLQASRLKEFVVKRSVIEYRLLACNIDDHHSLEEAEPNSTVAGSRVLKLAAQIFTNLTFRKMKAGSGLHTALGLRLRSAIVAFDQHPTSRHSTCLMLWASVMGCMGSLPGPTRMFFLGWVSHFAAELGVLDIGDLKLQLAKVMWVEALLGALCADVWRNLQEMGGVGGAGDFRLGMGELSLPMG